MKMDNVSKAVQYYEKGYMCSQAVFAAFAEQFGITEKQAFQKVEEGCLTDETAGNLKSSCTEGRKTSFAEGKRELPYGRNSKKPQK